MLKGLRDRVDGVGQNKVTTKSGHISDIEYEPIPPLLIDDEPPNEQEELDKVEDEIAVKKGVMLPTPSGTLRDRMDSMLNKRLEERIRQLQMFRTQIQDIQLQNKRDQLAKQIEINKVIDKLKRTRDRLEQVTDELKEERTEMVGQPREAHVKSASITMHVKRTGLISSTGAHVYSLADDRRQPIGVLQTYDDGNYWGIGMEWMGKDGQIPPRTVFEASSRDAKHFEPRDWNGEIQTELHNIMRRNFEKKYVTLRKLCELEENFKEFVVHLGRIIIDEDHIPFGFKSLKPLALPKRRKTMSELDTNDVLKQQVYKEDEWRNAYFFNNVLFEVSTDDVDFFDTEEGAMKAASNELRGQEFVALDCMEQDLHMPLSATLDHRGHRILATVALPPMADPKDLIDIFGHAQDMGDDAGGTAWDDAQADLATRVERLGKALNMQPHSIRFDDSKEDVSISADCQYFVGKDRKNYLMSCSRILPSEPPTYPLESKIAHLHKLLRPELIRTSPDPINSDVFTPFVGQAAREDNMTCRQLFNRLKKNVIPFVAQYLDLHGEDDQDVVYHLSKVLHRHGVNVRFLALVGRCVKSERIKTGIISEMVARHVKCDIRRRWRLLLSKGINNDSTFIGRTILVYNYLLTETPDADKFWNQNLTPGVHRKFVGALSMKGTSEWRDLVDIELVVKRVTDDLQIHFRTDPFSILERRPKLMIPDLVSIGHRVRLARTIPVECMRAFEFQVEGLKSTDPDVKRECYTLAMQEYDMVLNNESQENPMLMACAADCCLMLSNYLLFFKARDILERAEDLYRRALALRPQWKEVLNRLGDVHCEQAKRTRVPETAIRLRGRAGARYLQVLGLEWELQYALQKQKTHKLEHLFELPKSDLACISIATKKFTDFHQINFTETADVGENAIRRSIGKRPAVTDLNLSGCYHANDDAINFIAVRAERLQALNLSNVPNLSEDGVYSIAEITSLTSLTLDGTLGVNDPSLEAILRSCRNIKHLSLRRLPRVSNKSGLFIGKFITTLESLDMSETPQLTGSILNEVAQNCPNFFSAKADGCYTVDDVPCITMGRYAEKLQLVSLAGCVKLTSLAIRGLSDKCKVLQTLNFANCIKLDDSGIAVLAEKKAFPSLTSLDLSACDSITTEALVELVQVKPNFLTLKIGKCTQIGVQAVRRIANNCRLLQTLSLDSVVGATPEAISSVGVYCRGLQSLSLANCVEVDDSCIHVLAKCLSGLTELDLSGCKLVTDSSVSSVCETNTKLTALRLYACPRLGKVLQTAGEQCPLLKVFYCGLSNQVNDHGVMKLVTGCPELAELHLTNCPQVSDEIKMLLENQMPWLKMTF